MRPASALMGALFLLGGGFPSLPTPAVAGTGTTFGVNAHPWTQHYTDVGREGTSPGDYVDFTDKLFQHGDRVGRDAGHCVLKRVTERATTAQCMLTLTFRDTGGLTAQGVVKSNNPNPVLAVTGGTGDYAG